MSCHNEFAPQHENQLADKTNEINRPEKNISYFLSPRNHLRSVNRFKCTPQMLTLTEVRRKTPEPRQVNNMCVPLPNLLKNEKTKEKEENGSAVETPCDKSENGIPELP